MGVSSRRVDGETIRSDKTYSGARVLRLLEVSFANGRAAGIREIESHNEAELQKSWEAGYEEGQRAAEAEHQELIDALNILRKFIQSDNT